MHDDMCYIVGDIISTLAIVDECSDDVLGRHVAAEAVAVKETYLCEKQTTCVLIASMI